MTKAQSFARALLLAMLGAGGFGLGDWVADQIGARVPMYYSVFGIALFFFAGSALLYTIEGE